MHGVALWWLLRVGVVVVFAAHVTVAGNEDAFQIQDYAGIMASIRARFKNICIYYLKPSYLTLDDITLLASLRKVTSRQYGLTSVALRLPASGVGIPEVFTCIRPLIILPFFERDNLSLSAVSARGLAGSIWVQFLDASTSLEVFFAGVDIPFDTQFLVVRRVGGKVELLEVYRVRGDLALNTVPFGTWSGTGGLEANPLSLEERRNKLQGLVFRAVLTHEPPLVVVSGNGTNITVGGSIGNIFHELEEDLNYTTVYTLAPDAAFGAQAENGSWNGMVGMMVRGEVDMAVNAFVFTTQRMDVVDYTIPIFIKDYTIFIKVTAAMTKSSTFSAPFSKRLWLLIAASIFVLGFCLGSLMKVNRYCHEQEDEVQGTRFSFFESVFCIYSLFLHQSWDVIPHPASCRVVFLTALLASTVVLSAYSGVLISFLAVHNVEIPFHDIVGLLTDGDYKLGQFNVPPAYRLSNFFEISDNPELQVLSARIRHEEDDDPPKSVMDGLSRVCSSRFAFFAPTDEALDLVDDISCKLTAFPLVSVRVSQGLPMSRDSPYRSLFNQRLLKLRDGGVLEKLHADAWAWQFHSSDVTSQTSLQDVASLLALLLGGFVAAAILLALERVHLGSPRGRARAHTPGAGEQLNPVTKHNLNHAFENLYAYKVLDMLRNNSSAQRKRASPADSISRLLFRKRRTKRMKE